MKTIQEIADLAGVSRGTVDRVINHRGRVKKEVEDRVNELLKEVGYVQKPRKGVHFKIGVITQLREASFMQDIELGIQRACDEYELHGITFVVKHGRGVDEQEQLKLLEEVAKEEVHALAIMPMQSELVRKKINEVSERIPVVTFNSDILGTNRLCFVGMDNRKSGEVGSGLLGMLMRETGKVLLITGYFTNQANSSRVDGFISHMENNFPNIQLLGVQCSQDKADVVEKIITQTLNQHPDLEGIFIVSAGQEGIHSALHKRGVEKRPYVIAYDASNRNLKRLKRGDFDFIIDQESSRQGYLAIQVLYQLLKKNIQPASPYVYTDIQLRCKETL